MLAPAVSLAWILGCLFAFAEGWLGVYLDPEHDTPRVRELVPGSPADVAGIKAGDWIVAIDETPTPDVPALLVALKATRAGQKVAVKALRDGKERTFLVTLGERPQGGGVPTDPLPPDPSPQKGKPPQPAGETAQRALPILRDLAAAKVAAKEAGLDVVCIRGDASHALVQRQLRAFQEEVVQPAVIGCVVVFVDEKAQAGGPAVTVERTRGDELLWRHQGLLTHRMLRVALDQDAETPELDRLSRELAQLREQVARLSRELAALRAQEQVRPTSGK